MSQISIKKFQKTILDWYEINGRHSLPWRPSSLKLRRDGSCDPYAILVSEVMLQQTQVDRVIPKFERFLKVFPTSASLAKSSPAKLLAEWKGLGYSRRALNLQRACVQIEKIYGGCVPTDPELIDELPGVGHYTARAVAVFSFNVPHVFIETNIRRVFLHFFFQGKEQVSDQDILPFIKKALYVNNPRAWYSALMDYGALAMKEIPNPNTKSKHYARQSRFVGSRRYARAKALDFLLAQKRPMTLGDIQVFLKEDAYLLRYSNERELTSLLASLTEEGFLVCKKKCWAVKG